MKVQCTEVVETPAAVGEFNVKLLEGEYVFSLYLPRVGLFEFPVHQHGGLQASLASALTWRNDNGKPSLDGFIDMYVVGELKREAWVGMLKEGILTELKKCPRCTRILYPVHVFKEAARCIVCEEEGGREP